MLPLLLLQTLQQLHPMVRQLREFLFGLNGIFTPTSALIYCLIQMLNFQIQLHNLMLDTSDTRRIRG